MPAADTSNGGVLPRLVKCLELTTSNHDGEALAAARKANVLRKKLAASWAELMAPAPKPDQDEIDFGVVFSTIHEWNPPSGKWAEILSSIESFHRARRYLTARQRRLIDKFYKTALKRMREAGR